MNKEKLITFSVVVFVLLVAGGIIYFKSTTGLTTQDTASEKVAKYIGEHSVLYVLPTCSHCRNQENLFGANVKYLKIIDCVEAKEICIIQGIEATPTWIINGEKYVGKKTIEELKELTGYK